MPPAEPRWWLVVVAPAGDRAAGRTEQDQTENDHGDSFCADASVVRFPRISAPRAGQVEHP